MFGQLARDDFHLFLVGFSDLVSSPLLALFVLHLAAVVETLGHLVFHLGLHVDEHLGQVAVLEESLLLLPLLALCVAL